MMCGGGASGVTGPQHSASCTSSAQSPQCCGGIGVPLRGGEAVQTDGFCSVLGNTLTVLKHVGQVALSGCKPLRCCKAVESHSLGIVLRNAQPVRVAPSDNLLPKAAARRRALPSQRKPSRFIFGNTGACNEA